MCYMLSEWLAGGGEEENEEESVIRGDEKGGHRQRKIDSLTHKNIQ